MQEVGGGLQLAAPTMKKPSGAALDVWLAARKRAPCCHHCLSGVESGPKGQSSVVILRPQSLRGVPSRIPRDTMRPGTGSGGQDPGRGGGPERLWHLVREALGGSAAEGVGLLAGFGWFDAALPQTSPAPLTQSLTSSPTFSPLACTTQEKS
ncbi:hypothetical protein FALCPG4_000303 [Fusarium falciforme]